MRQSLEELSLDEHSIERLVAEYQALLRSGLPRDALIDRIHALLPPVQELESWTELHHVPLYRFGAPRVHGAAVTYHEQETVEREPIWKLTVFGMGGGGSRRKSWTVSHAYTVENGECRCVYVPIWLRVTRVLVQQNMRAGIRAEMEPDAHSSDPWSGRGCEKLHVGECRVIPGEPADDVIEYESPIDDGGWEAVERSWTTERTREFSLELNRVVGIGPRVRVKRTRTITLSLTLPHGHRYRGLLSVGSLRWERPERYTRRHRVHA